MPAFALLLARILDRFFADERRRVVDREIGREHVADGGLSRQSLLRRDAHAILGRGIVEPQDAAEEHHLAGIAWRIDIAREIAELARRRIDLGIYLKDVAIGGLARTIFGQHGRGAEWLLRIADGVGFHDDLLCRLRSRGSTCSDKHRGDEERPKRHHNTLTHVSTHRRSAIARRDWREGVPPPPQDRSATPMSSRQDPTRRSYR